MIKVIIAGGRGFTNYQLLKLKCDQILVNVKKDIQIVSGGARGADELGERYAKEKHYSVKRFEARWDIYGKRAGFIRNQEMAEYADALIAFWDGKTPGTRMMISLAHERVLKVRVVKYV